MSFVNALLSTLGDGGQAAKCCELGEGAGGPLQYFPQSDSLVQQKEFIYDFS